jgi:hypothetical protein
MTGADLIYRFALGDGFRGSAGAKHLRRAAMERDESPTHGRVSWRSAVALMVIAFLVVGLLCHAVQRVRISAARMQTYNNLKSVSLACHTMNGEYKRLPPAFAPEARIDFPASLHVHLMPYIESSTFYVDFIAARGQGPVCNLPISWFLSPLDDSCPPSAEGIANLAANLRVFSSKGVDTRFDFNMPPLGDVEPGSASIPGTFKDGTSNTILFATKYAVCGAGGSRYASAPTSPFAPFFGQNAALAMPEPEDAAAAYQLRPEAGQCRTVPLLGQSFTADGLEVGMSDASTRSISPRVSARTWNLLVQPNDGPKAPDDWNN